MDEPSLRELMQAARKRDLDAMSLLLRRVRPLVMRRCMKYLTKMQEIEDATQEISLKIYEQLPGLIDTETFLSWLMRIVSNHCIDKLRSKKRQYREVDLFRKETAVAEDESQLEELYYAISTLPVLEREILLRRYYEGMSLEEIGETIGRSPRTVSRYLSKARERLKEILQYEEE